MCIRDSIKTYLENGGHLFVTTDLTVSTPNLDALLAEYGMTRQEGLVIENDLSLIHISSNIPTGRFHLPHR